MRTCHAPAPAIAAQTSIENGSGATVVPPPLPPCSVSGVPPPETDVELDVEVEDDDPAADAEDELDVEVEADEPELDVPETSLSKLIVNGDDPELYGCKVEGLYAVN